MGSHFTWIFFLTSTLQDSLRMSIFLSICLSLIWIGLILGAGISLTSPYLSNLTKHGKLFVSSSSLSSSLSSSQFEDNFPLKYRNLRTGQMSCFSTIFSFAQQLLKGLEKYSLPKSTFSHFYVVGSVLNLLTLFNQVSSSFSPAFISPRSSCLTNVFPFSFTLNNTILITVLLLYQIHLSRRWYECKKVHRFGSSKMNLIGYLVGILHYCFVPLTFVNLSNLIHN